ncbi:putative ubiquitin fusion degradation protein 1 [Calycina marina]|uniref:Ubiquitin fusion degradation protein 1 n=1 Tax=Calycina marina TaxID=1763456 RepID=A0A9P8CC85_9HELO|nr:putative ubiquitin fusion degradation protein 1 [Calycina marina]
MSYGNYGDPEEFMAMMQAVGRGGQGLRRFDEYYRCYPAGMLPGPDRDHINFGGKIILPPSALEKLTRLHIEYPMNFELISKNGEVKTTHAGVLEFVAEEGKVYLPPWMMDTLNMELGDMLQIKSTSLKPASYVKIQPQSVDFLEITDPKAVLEMAMRGFATLTQGDKFKFKYNENVYEVAVLEVKPTSEKMGVSMIETDVSVDFAPPVGHVEPTSNRGSGTNTPKSVHGIPAGGTFHQQGTMAAAINYDAIKPTSDAAAAGARAFSSNFLTGGQKLSKKGAKTSAPQASTPVAGAYTNPPPQPLRRTNGPQPLRLAPNRLFFGYDIVPLKTQAEKDKENADALQPHFAGQGNTLRPGAKRKADAEKMLPEVIKPEPSVGRRLDGRKVEKHQS